MTRDELIEAGAQAVKDRYYGTVADALTAGLIRQDVATAVDAVEPLIRAEYEGDIKAWEETMRRYVNGVLADLRAKVEAMDVFVTTNNLLGTTRYVRLGDVLDLIDGSSDE